jgi:hypothetical protein
MTIVFNFYKSYDIWILKLHMLGALKDGANARITIARMMVEMNNQDLIYNTPMTSNVSVPRMHLE